MSKLVAALERDRLVARRADGADHRAVIVGLTPAGQALARRARARKIAWIGTVLRGCPAGDAQATARTASHLDRAAIIPPPPIPSGLSRRIFVSRLAPSASHRCPRKLSLHRLRRRRMRRGRYSGRILLARSSVLHC
jgi:hypothetical protein